MHDYSVSEIQNVVVFQRFQADFFVDILHAKENVGHAMFVMTHSHQNNAEKSEKVKSEESGRRKSKKVWKKTRKKCFQSNWLPMLSLFSLYNALRAQKSKLVEEMMSYSALLLTGFSCGSQ